jgi:hypothetical protein
MYYGDGRVRATAVGLLILTVFPVVVGALGARTARCAGSYTNVAVEATVISSFNENGHLTHIADIIANDFGRKCYRLNHCRDNFAYVNAVSNQGPVQGGCPKKILYSLTHGGCIEVSNKRHIFKALVLHDLWDTIVGKLEAKRSELVFPEDLPTAEPLGEVSKSALDPKKTNYSPFPPGTATTWRNDGLNYDFVFINACHAGEEHWDNEPTPRSNSEALKKKYNAQVYISTKGGEFSNSCCAKEGMAINFGTHFFDTLKNNRNTMTFEQALRATQDNQHYHILNGKDTAINKIF